MAHVIEAMFILFGIAWVVATCTFSYWLIRDEFSKPNPYSVWNMLKEKRKNRKNT